MNFKTPFHLCGGRVLDRDYRPIVLHPKRFRLTDDAQAARTFLKECVREGVNLIHAEFTEALLTESDGTLKNGPALDLLDDFMEEWAGYDLSSEENIRLAIQVRNWRSVHNV